MCQKIVFVPKINLLNQKKIEVTRLIDILNSPRNSEGLEEGYRFINVLRKLNMERHLTLNLNTIESHLTGNKKADN